METSSRLAIRVGIFFTIAILIVLGLSLQVGKRGLFDHDYEIVANFRQGSGIDPGTRVSLRGVPIGTVKSMDWDAGKYRVAMVLQIENRYRIPKNAVAKIQVSSLLGGNYVNISVDQGPEEIAALVEGDEIQTEDTLSIDEVLTTFGNLGDQAKTLMANLDKNQAETMEKIRSVIEENRKEFKETSTSFARLGPKLETLADRVNTMTEQVQGGEGTFGALFTDKSVYTDIKEFASTAREVGDQVKSGQGALGQLVYKDDLTNDAKNVMSDLQKAAQEVEAAVSENREGFRDLVASVSESGPRIEQAISDLNDITRKINSGEGTLGRLVNDPSLYEDAQRTVNQVGESFESSEEQGVFRSFLGLIFGALI